MSLLWKCLETFLPYIKSSSLQNIKKSSNITESSLDTKYSSNSLSKTKYSTNILPITEYSSNTLSNTKYS